MTTAGELIKWLSNLSPDTPVYVVSGDNDELCDAGEPCEVTVHGADCCPITCGGKSCGLCKLGYRTRKAVTL